MVEKIRTIVDRMHVGLVVEEFQVELNSGPGRANSKCTISLVGCGKQVTPSAITAPATTIEHGLGAGAASIVICGTNYITAKSLVSLRYGWKNNIRLDTGYFPGSGVQTTGDADSGAIRGRMEYGDRVATLGFVARFDAGSSELATMLAQTEGTALITLNGATIAGAAAHKAEALFHRVTFRSAVISDADGIVTVEVDCVPLYHSSNGLLTCTGVCEQDNIGA
jgi:hypothetical protein